MNTSFSVLMSLYYKEQPEYFRQSLKSIFEQTLSPSEVIIVEDGPLTNELYSILQEYCNKYHEIKRVPLQSNKGLGLALNEGLKYCSHDLIIRMDTDDICFPNRFEKQVLFMLQNPEIDISSSWIEEFEDNITNIKSIKKVPASNEEIARYICSRNPLNHPAVIFRKTSVSNVGGYKHFPLFEDWFLWVRMFVNGAYFANIQEPLLHFRVSQSMFKRRGGIKYALNSTRFQWTLYKLGLISILGMLKGSLIRSIVYMMPNKLRTIFYSKFLRS